MAVFQEAIGAHFKDTNISSTHIITLVSNPAEERMAGSESQEEKEK